MSLKTSSRTTRSRPFPLLRLPYELLDTIFEYAYEDDERPGPVCRALRQFGEKRFYRDVKIVDYSSLAKFCSTINKSNRLAQLVRTLNLDFAGCEDENLCVEPIAPGRTQRRVTVGSFATMLSRVVKLKSLRMVELEDGLYQVVTSARPASSSMPELEVLDLMQYSIDVLDEGVWVRRLSSLREIRLHSAFGRLPLPRAVAPMQADTLVLSGPCARFEASDLMDESQYLSVIQGLPRTLKKLQLEHSDGWVAASGSLDYILPEFQNLDCLYLCFTLPHLTTYLVAAVNLVSLGFGIDTPVTDEFLLSLVKEARPPNLNTLVLDYVTCGRGLTMESQGFELSEEAADTLYHMYPGWWEPVWPDDCTEMGLYWVIAAAEDAEIILEGTALAADNWEEDYGGEIIDALLIWGLEVDDFEEAREVLGDRYVANFQAHFG